MSTLRPDRRPGFPENAPIHIEIRRVAAPFARDEVWERIGEIRSQKGLANAERALSGTYRLRLVYRVGGRRVTSGGGGGAPLAPWSSRHSGPSLREHERRGKWGYPWAPHWNTANGGEPIPAVTRDEFRMRQRAAYLASLQTAS